jgi:predicted transcriptional regulator
VSTRRGFGELEAEVQAALWAADGPLTAAEVREQLDGDLAYTTVLTILKRLFDKGIAVRTPAESGRAFRYAPAVEQAEHAAQQMHAYMAASSDSRAVLARFLGQLSPADRRTLSDLLRGRRK